MEKNPIDLIGRKPNEFILASQDLTALQHKALLGMLTKFKFDARLQTTPEQISELADIEFSIPLSDLVPDYEKAKGGELFRRARSQIEGLMAQTIRIDTGSKLRNYNLVSFSEIDTGTSKIKAKFNRDVVPILVAMVERGYTELSLTYVRQLKSAYSIRIYELLMKNRKLSHVQQYGYKLELETLRALLGLKSDVYPLFGDFNRRVLLQADKEINSEKTNLRYKYEHIRDGRKVTHIRFYDLVLVEPLDSDEKKISEGTEQITLEIESDHPLRLLNKKDAVAINNQHSEEYIQFYYKRCRRLQREGAVKKSFEGFFFKMLKDDPADFYNTSKAVPARSKKAGDEQKTKTYKELSDEALILFAELPLQEQETRISFERESTLFTDEEALRRQAALKYVNAQP